MLVSTSYPFSFNFAIVALISPSFVNGVFESPVSVIGVSNTFPFGSTKLVIAFCCPSFTYVIGVS